jgi:hypothetical protein
LGVVDRLASLRDLANPPTSAMPMLRSTTNEAEHPATKAPGRRDPGILPGPMTAEMYHPTVTSKSETQKVAVTASQYLVRYAKKPIAK